VKEKTMAPMTRWIAPAILAAGLGFGAMAAPAPVQAQDELTRVLVDIADVVLRGGQPYYRHGNYGYDDRLIVVRDRYGRPTYYRRVPAHEAYNRGRSGPPYGVAHGYYRNGPGSRDFNPTARNVKCNKHGKCKVEYYDPRYDRDAYRYSRYDRRYDRRDRRGWDD
jgi:hypothetical protein